jgi:excisionase family DNA binding protein
MSKQPQQTPPPTQLLSVTTVAERLDVSQDTVRRLIARGELSAIRIGAAVRVAAADLEAFLDRRMRGRP